MKLFTPYKKARAMLVFFCLAGYSLMGNAFHNISANPEPAQERYLSEVLDEIGEKYQVFFNYESEFIKNVKVDFELKKEEKLKQAVDRLFAQTDLKYEFVNTKFILIFKNDKSGKKGIKKIRRKILQLEKLKKKEGVSIQRNSTEGSNLWRSIAQGMQEMTAVFPVTGTITDEAGLALIGVNILIKGTSTGTITDLEGNFSLDLDDGQEVLLISYTGYEPLEIAVNGRSVLQITMRESISQLEEIVVVGYGTAKLKNITGSVARIDLENSPLSLIPNTNVLQSLRGGIAGVNVGPQNNVGQTPDILVRGQNSINGSNDPLIVLDGVLFLGNISDINPADIADISVLKDASAAAAYGSRSANGVIMINTKKGMSDKPTIRFGTSVGVNTWLKRNKTDLMETPRYLEKYAAQNNFATVDDIVYDDEARNILMEQRVNTDWIDLISRNGLIQDYQLSVSGRSDRINYYFSGGHQNQEGVIIGDDYQRNSIRTRLDVDITDWLEVGIDGSYNQSDYSGIGANVFYGNWYAPIGYPYIYDGWPNNASSNTSRDLARWPAGSSIQSPLWGTDGSVEDINKRDFYRFSGYALFRVPNVDGLTFRLNYTTYSNLYTEDRFFSEHYYIKEHASPPFYDPYLPASLQNNLTEANGFNRRRKINNYVADFIVNYNKEFGNHYVDLTLAATRDFTSDETSQWNGRNFASNGNTVLGVNGLAFAEVQTNSLNIVERSNIGYLARIGYSFKQKYHLNASYRRDGASVFGNDKKWGDFPSVGVAWTVSEEPFLEDGGLLNYLKLKGSYGINGNQGVDPYGTLAPVSNGQSGGEFYEFGDAPSTLLYGIRQDALANPNLGWETTTSFNGGFESAWFGNKVFLDVDFYFTETTDQIFARQIPIMTGFTTIISSLGQVDNNGLEINLRANILEGVGLNWSSGLSLWNNRNKVVSIYGDDIDGDGKEDDDIANSLFIGEPLGAIYGYDFIGVVQETDADYIEKNGAQGGDPMFRDLDGDGVITAEDRAILGYSMPNYRLGWTNTVSFKNFTLYMMISGILGGNGHYQKANPYATSFYNRFDTNEMDHDWWTPENKSEKFLRPDYIGGRYLGLESRGYIRIQDITLSYNLPSPALNSLGLNSLQVYATVKNLHTFTNWSGGGDPEAGVEILSGTYPVPTVYSFGLNVSF